MGKDSLGKNSPEPKFEPRRAGRGVLTLPLCYANPPASETYSWSYRLEALFRPHFEADSLKTRQKHLKLLFLFNPRWPQRPQRPQRPQPRRSLRSKRKSSKKTFRWIRLGCQDWPLDNRPQKSNPQKTGFKLVSGQFQTCFSLVLDQFQTGFKLISKRFQTSFKLVTN